MTILIIMGMAIITFSFRFVPLLFTNHTNGSSKVQALLEYLPIAVLSALTVPGIIQVDPDVNLVGIASGTVAVILVLIRKIPLLFVILGSVSAALLVKMLTMYF
ncbi:AzlD domain-containing protein [Paenibacillus sp. FSL K6-0276]|uniref:AzlD domain-containing protein n=1 Tax=unclassified Paenibacillus TaxID=185978 RepID=UPI0028A99551|nr:AzlD domain-containing protein [Paenibacillus sp.]